MGLLLGASVVSLVELLDWLFYHWMYEEGVCSSDKSKESRKQNDQLQMNSAIGRYDDNHGRDSDRSTNGYRNNKGPDQDYRDRYPGDRPKYVNHAYDLDSQENFTNPRQLRLNRINGAMRPYAYEQSYGNWPRM